MTRALLFAAMLGAGTAAAGDPPPPQVVRPGSAPAADAGAARGFLAIDVGGCGGPATADETPVTTWTGPDSAENVRVLWLSSREHVLSGPVEVEVRGSRVFAWVPVQVDAIVAGEPVPTCLQPLTLRLTVQPLPAGDYEWVMRRGTRAEDTGFEQAVADADAQAARDAETAD